MHISHALAKAHTDADGELVKGNQLSDKEVKRLRRLAENQNTELWETALWRSVIINQLTRSDTTSSLPKTGRSFINVAHSQAPPLGFPRSAQVIAQHFRTGHGRFPSHRHGKMDQDLLPVPCTKCRHPNGDRDHILLSCPAYSPRPTSWTSRESAFQEPGLLLKWITSTGAGSRMEASHNIFQSLDPDGLNDELAEELDQVDQEDTRFTAAGGNRQRDEDAGAGDSVESQGGGGGGNDVDRGDFVYGGDLVDGGDLADGGDFVDGGDCVGQEAGGREGLGRGGRAGQGGAYVGQDFTVGTEVREAAQSSGDGEKGEGSGGKRETTDWDAEGWERGESLSYGGEMTSSDELQDGITSLSFKLWILGLMVLLLGWGWWRLRGEGLGTDGQLRVL